MAQLSFALEKLRWSSGNREWSAHVTPDESQLLLDRIAELERENAGLRAGLKAHEQLSLRLA